MIEAFRPAWADRYGEMIIDGCCYRKDMVLYPDHIEPFWERRERHVVEIADMYKILRQQPEYLLIGTGQPGLLRVLLETQEYILHQGIQLVAVPTENARQLYNRIYDKCYVIGAFHLGC